MNIRLSKETLDHDSIVDGSGIRTVIWTQGCSHHCKGCHNPETHDFKAGFIRDIEDIKNEIQALEGQDGITLSGGDPFYQVEPCLEIARFSKSLGLDVWCYTGFQIEELLQMAMKNPSILDFLKQIDILVDGRFEISQKSLNIMFRGSKNQRIIDVKKTLEMGKVIEPLEYKLEKSIVPFYQRNECIFI